MNKDIVRSRTVDCHSPSETTPMPPQRTFSRQSLLTVRIIKI